MFKLSMPPLPVGTSHVLFDISRLARSTNRSFATGVDRIDLAIGLNLVARFADRCHFLYARRQTVIIMQPRVGRALLHYLDGIWNGGRAPRPPRQLALRLSGSAFLKAILPSRRNAIVGPDTTYVVSSHSGIGKIPGALRRLDPNRLMRRLVYLHDIIPLEMPEYQRPQNRDSFADYLGELTDAPLTIATNSHDTDHRVRRLADRSGWSVQDYLVLMPTLEALASRPLPIRPEVQAYLADPRPFFMVIGTIEPRKNHLLLLHLWRQFAVDGRSGSAMPRLCIVGKRGWENENILDMLDRCEVIRDSVQEFGDLGDQDVQVLMQHARALLFPSFIEGLGIPLLEAAALDVPCVVSDIPVFHEVAPAGTVFLDPLDGPGWRRAILERLVVS